MGGFEYFQSRGCLFLVFIKSHLCMISKKAIVYDFFKKLLSLKQFGNELIDDEWRDLEFQGLFTWIGGPWSSGVDFFCFHSKQNKRNLSHQFPTRPEFPTPCKQGLRPDVTFPRSVQKKTRQNSFMFTELGMDPNDPGVLQE